MKPILEKVSGPSWVRQWFMSNSDFGLWLMFVIFIITAIKCLIWIVLLFLSILI